MPRAIAAATKDEAVRLDLLDDGTAKLKSSSGGELTLDANIVATSNDGSTVNLDPDVTIKSGGKVKTCWSRSVESKGATVEQQSSMCIVELGQAKYPLKSPNAELAAISAIDGIDFDILAVNLNGLSRARALDRPSTPSSSMHLDPALVLRHEHILLERRHSLVGLELAIAIVSLGRVREHFNDDGRVNDRLTNTSTVLVVNGSSDKGSTHNVGIRVSVVLSRLDEQRSIGSVGLAAILKEWRQNFANDATRQPCVLGSATRHRVHHSIDPLVTVLALGLVGKELVIRDDEAYRLPRRPARSSRLGSTPQLGSLHEAQPIMATRSAVPGRGSIHSGPVTSTPHDAIFKICFQQTRHAADELRHVLPPELVALVDWSSLTLCPTELIDTELSPAGPDAFERLFRYASVALEELRFEEFRDKLVELIPSSETFVMTIAQQLEARGEARGRAAGEAIGRRKTLLLILETRGVQLSDQQRARIETCENVEQLDAWARLAVQASNPEDVFGAP